MADSMASGGMPNRNDCSETYDGYLKRAVDACEAGDLVLGMHLYLAAYEKAVIDPDIPDGMALAGLREAWSLACDLKERSLAEYVFEKLEPYLTGDEIAACAQRLQDLALDHLEQYGFSREDLEGMAQMISQDLVGDGSVLKVESIAIRSASAPNSLAAQTREAVAAADDSGQDAKREEAICEQKADSPTTEADADDGQLDAESQEPPRAKGSKPGHVNMNAASVDDFNPYDYYRDYSVGKSYHAATNEGSDAYVFSRDEERIEAGQRAKEQAESREAREVESEQQASPPAQDDTVGAKALEVAKEVAAKLAEAVQASIPQAIAPQAAVPQTIASQGDTPPAATPQAIAPQAIAPQAATPQPAAPQAGTPASSVEPASMLNYKNLVGYDEVISIMRDYGVGLQNDRGFTSFVNMLNERHGLDRAPAMDTMLVRAPVIEDAARFVEATIGEIGLPALRMSMEEGAQGVPLLCVTLHGNSRPRMNHAHNRFEAPAILVIEDLDTWVMPSMPENVEGMNGLVMANISRGAREAVNMIRASVEDPDVYVLATCTTSGEADPFFYDMLEPMTIVDVGLPTDKERIDIWTEIARNHPSMRSINRSDLMRYSEGLSRYDLYIAAREAIEEAYKSGLVQRSYVPVTPYNIFEKLAACQPLDSDAYRALEDEAVRSLQAEFSELEDLINSGWN